MMSSSNMEICKKPSKTFQEGWPIVETFLDRIINKVEGVDNSSFSNKDLMSYYTTVYELCTPRNSDNAKLLYIQCKKAIEEYINSTVMPSLRGKEDDILLRELLRRWSNHKTMTTWISRIFHCLDRYDQPSVEETCLLSFYDLVFDEMNKQVVDAVLFMIDRDRAGEHIDRTLVNNTLAIYFEIGDGVRKNHAKGFAERMVKHNAEISYGTPLNWIASSSSMDSRSTPKEEKSHEDLVLSSKRIELESSEGVVYEVDYNTAFMSRTIEDLINANPHSDEDDDEVVAKILLPLVSSKILRKVIEYCKKHAELASNTSHQKELEITCWDDEFVEVDEVTLFDLIMASKYLNIQGLNDVSANKVAEMMKGKSPSQIRKMFNIDQGRDYPTQTEKGGG